MNKKIKIVLLINLILLFGMVEWVAAEPTDAKQLSVEPHHDSFQEEEGSSDTITETVEISSTLTATPVPTRRSPGQLYVSKAGSNEDGTSWESAWNELNQIDWSIVVPGDVIFIDGGGSDAGLIYTSTLKPAANGTEDLPITLQLADEPGRDGKATIFGGNSIPLPECGLLEWDESELDVAGSYGIELENGVSNIIIDGTKRGGITIHGWREAGITFDPDRIDNQQDDNTHNVTLRYMEIFNNGKIEQIADSYGEDGSPIGPEFYLPFHGSPGIKLSGSGHRFEFLEVHDNAADGIQSNFTSPENSVFNNIDDITISFAWFYNQRAHSGIDNGPEGAVCSAEDQSGCDELGAPSNGFNYHQYPDEPTDRREAFNWCTHNDGVQIYSSQDLNSLVLENSIFGPNLMNALILGDRGNSNATAWVNDLVMENVVVTRFTNNALGMNNEQPNVGSNWKIDKTTIYGHYNKQNMGSLSLQSSGADDEHLISNTINVFGRSEFPEGNVVFDNNCEFEMYTGSIQGEIADPEFVNISQADYFENDLSVDFATVFADDYKPQNNQCLTSGSRLTSVSQLISIFENPDNAQKLDEEILVPPTATPEPTATPLPDPTPQEGADDHNPDSVIDDDPQLNSNSEEIRLLIILGIVALIIFILLVILIVYAWRLNGNPPQ